MDHFLTAEQIQSVLDYTSFSSTLRDHYNTDTVHFVAYFVATFFLNIEETESLTHDIDTVDGCALAMLTNMIHSCTRRWTHLEVQDIMEKGPRDYGVQALPFLKAVHKQYPPKNYSLLAFLDISK